MALVEIQPYFSGLSHALTTDGIPCILALLHFVGSQCTDVFDGARIIVFYGLKSNYAFRLCDVVKVDGYFAYNNSTTAVHDAIREPASVRLDAIYTLGGVKVKEPEVGRTYIFRYTDGTSRKVFVK